MEIQPERPDLHGLDMYRRGTGNTLVEGCKLGGRAKRIFVDVVKEDMKFVGTGG